MSVFSTNYIVPISITAAALCNPIINVQNQQHILPQQYHTNESYAGYLRNWEIQPPTTILSIDDYNKIETIYRFAQNLIEKSEDIPVEFAKVINEDFWEIL